jgi:lipoate---protein ligase
MQLLNLTLPAPEENLALDEALLDQLDSDDSCVETLRFWEIDPLCVVLGRSSYIEQEVFVERADADGVPILRRATGGSTVLAGRGCMMYSVIMSISKRPHLRMIDAAHDEVISSLKRALRRLLPEVDSDGICDLTYRGRKFSGNALRIKRNAVLYHGTILYGMPTDLIAKYLREPPRQPDYRSKRQHDEFVTRVPLEPQLAMSEIAREWQASEARSENSLPWDRVRELVASRYQLVTWHRSR